MSLPHLKTWKFRYHCINFTSPEFLLLDTEIMYAVSGSSSPSDPSAPSPSFSIPSPHKLFSYLSLAKHKREPNEIIVPIRIDRGNTNPKPKLNMSGGGQTKTGEEFQMETENENENENATESLENRRRRIVCERRLGLGMRGIEILLNQEEKDENEEEEEEEEGEREREREMEKHGGCVVKRLLRKYGAIDDLENRRKDWAAKCAEMLIRECLRDYLWWRSRTRTKTSNETSEDVDPDEGDDDVVDDGIVVVREGDVRLIPHGSYLLNSHLPTSDIDMVCVFAKSMNQTNSRFSNSFLEDFRVWMQTIASFCPVVSDVRSIPKARVPLMKFHIGTVEVEVPLVWSTLNQVPSSARFLENLKTMPNVWVRRGDHTSALPLSGLRQNLRLMEIFQGREEIFQDVARFVKLWARRHGVYSTVLGYLSGELVHILVTRSMQNSNPRNSFEGVVGFFRTFAEWDYDRDLIISVLASEGDQSAAKDLNRVHVPLRVLKPTLVGSIGARNASRRVTWGTFGRIVEEIRHAYLFFSSASRSQESLLELVMSSSCPVDSNCVLLVSLHADSRCEEARGLIVPFEIMLRQRFDLHRLGTSFHYGCVPSDDPGVLVTVRIALCLDDMFLGSPSYCTMLFDGIVKKAIGSSVKSMLAYRLIEGGWSDLVSVSVALATGQEE